MNFFESCKREALDRRNKRKNMNKYEKMSDKKLSDVACGKMAHSIADQARAIEEMKKRGKL